MMMKKSLTAAPLDPGKELTLEFNDVRLKKGDRRVAATADSKKAVAESDEVQQRAADDCALPGRRLGEIVGCRLSFILTHDCGPTIG